MILDAFLQLAGSYSGSTVTGQDVFSTGSSVVTTNSVDTRGGSVTAPGASGQSLDLGKGEPLALEFTVTTAFSGGTSAAFEVVNADAGDLTTNVTVIGSSGAIAIASLTLGKKIRVPISSLDPRAVRRYLGGRVTCVGTVTAGAVVASIVPLNFTGDVPPPSYASGFDIA